MYAITDRQKRIWDHIYAITFSQDVSAGNPAYSAHSAAVEVADNAVGQLIAAQLPVEQMAEDRVDRFRPRPWV